MSPLSLFNPGRSLLVTVLLRNDSMRKISSQPLPFGFGCRANAARGNNAPWYHTQVLHKNQVWMSQSKPFSIVFEVAASERRSGRAQGILLHLTYTQMARPVVTSAGLGCLRSSQTLAETAFRAPRHSHKQNKLAHLKSTKVTSVPIMTKSNFYLNTLKSICCD